MNLKEALVSGTGQSCSEGSGGPRAPLLEARVIIPPEMHRLFLLFGCEGAGGLETLADYLAQAKAPQRHVRMAEVLEWAERTFSGLELRVAWNQPVFTDHGTFIVGISVSAGHLAVSPGRAWSFFREIARGGYAGAKCCSASRGRGTWITRCCAG